MTDENLTQSDTILDITKQTSYVVKAGGVFLKCDYVVISKEKAEQARTIKNKIKFLKVFGTSLGIIRSTCKTIGISRETFYTWWRNDKDFAQAILVAGQDRNSEVQDQLFQKIHDGDGACIRFYLERKDPGYKAKSVSEIVPGTGISLEEALENYALNKIKEEDGQNKDIKKDAKQPDDNRVDVSDKKQAGPSGAVPVQPGPKAVLETKDTKKPDTESPAKGPK